MGALAARIEAIGPYADCPRAAAALREYAALIERSEALVAACERLVALRDDIGIEAHWHSDEDDWIAYQTAWAQVRAEVARFRGGD